MLVVAEGLWGERVVGGIDEEKVVVGRRKGLKCWDDVVLG